MSSSTARRVALPDLSFQEFPKVVDYFRAPKEGLTAASAARAAARIPQRA